MRSLHGRDALLRAVETALLNGTPGCLLGPPGSGRTSVLDVLGERLGAPARRVDGSAAHGAVTRQLGISDDGIAAYTRAPAALRADGAVVLVDDADALDRAAAVLLAQLARAGVPLLIAASDLHDLPAPLAKTAHHGDWTVHRLEALSDDAILRVAADRIGDDLSAESAAFLLDRAEGNPAIAVELLASARTTLQHTAIGVELGRPGLTERLVSLHAPKFRELEATDHDWLVRLSVAEQLPAALFAPAALDHLLTAGLVVREDDRVAMAGTLLVDIVREELSVDAWQLACSALAEELTEHGPDWSATVSLLRIRAGMALDADSGLRAAERAVAAHRWVEASDLLAGIDPSTMAAHHEPRLALLRGAALSGSGEHEAAVRHLRAALESPASDPGLMVQVGSEIGLLHAVRRSDPATAVREVTAIADRLDAAHRSALDADLVKWHLMAGFEPPALPGAAAAANLAGQLGVSVVGAMIASLDGDPAEARCHVAQGMALVEQGAAPGHAVHLLGLSHYLSLAFDARLDAAEQWAVGHRARAARTADPALGMWEFAAAELGLHAGRLDLALAMVDRAARHLTWQDFTGLRMSARAMQAAVGARRGTLDDSLRTVADLGDEARADVKVQLHVARVHAERHRLVAEHRLAAEVLAAAGRRAVDESHRHLGLLAIDEAWMVNPSAHLLDLISAQAGLSPLADLFLPRAEAWHAGDAAALERAGRDLAASGLLSRATHAWGMATALHAQAGDTEAAKRASRARVVLTVESGCSSWPGDGDAAALTSRELEIARLAAARVRSREIAVRLGLSVRTVDNHIGRILRKLGVSRRSELEHVFRDIDRSD